MGFLVSCKSRSRRGGNAAIFNSSPVICGSPPHPTIGVSGLLSEQGRLGGYVPVFPESAPFDLSVQTPVRAQASHGAHCADVRMQAQPSEEEAQLNSWLSVLPLPGKHHSNYHIVGRTIEYKLAYRLVLGGREKARWVRIWKITCSEAARGGLPQALRSCVTSPCVRVNGAGGRPLERSLREQKPLGSDCP